MKEKIEDLINRWQNAMHPGRERPFRLHLYQNENAIWLVHIQSDRKQRLSRNRMEADIEMTTLRPQFDAAEQRITELTHKISNTADQNQRQKLQTELRAEEKKKLPLKLRLDELGNVL